MVVYFNELFKLFIQVVKNELYLSCPFGMKIALSEMIHYNI